MLFKQTCPACLGWTVTRRELRDGGTDELGGYKIALDLCLGCGKENAGRIYVSPRHFVRRPRKETGYFSTEYGCGPGVVYWYDFRTRWWTVYTVDRNGYQEGEAKYGNDKKEAREIAEGLVRDDRRIW